VFSVCAQECVTPIQSTWGSELHVRTLRCLNQFSIHSCKLRKVQLDVIQSWVILSSPESPPRCLESIAAGNMMRGFRILAQRGGVPVGRGPFIVGITCRSTQDLFSFGSLSKQASAYVQYVYVHTKEVFRSEHAILLHLAPEDCKPLAVHEIGIWGRSRRQL